MRTHGALAPSNVNVSAFSTFALEILLAAHFSTRVWGVCSGPSKGNSKAKGGRERSLVGRRNAAARGFLCVVLQPALMDYSTGQ